ncbi:MAG: translocation/assembly module TamB, partial [Bacteroidetes bacterium]|nr:translocation/assembly module TamB [Bacteroidota bacterium]
RPLDDIKNAAYDLHLETKGLQLGYILKDTATFGALSGVFNAKGRGLDMHNMHAIANGNISSVTLKGYTYQALKFDGNANGSIITATAAANDPNLRFALDLHANTTNKYPSVQTTLRIDTVNALALHLADSLLTYHGLVTADFANTDPDQLDGKLLVTESILQQPHQRIALDTLRLLAGANDSGRFVRLGTQIADLHLYGQYRLTQLGDIFTQVINPYYTISDSLKKKPVDSYNFFINASVVDGPMLRTLVPDLKKLSPVTLTGHFSDKDTLKLALNAPLIVVGANEISGLQLTGNGDRDKLKLQLDLARIKAGKMDIFATSLNTSLSGNKIDFALNNKDAKGKDKYHLEGLLEHIREQYGFSLKPDNLLLNYNRWTINADNKIVIGKGNPQVNRFELSRNGEKLAIQSSGTAPNDSMRVQFDNFRIGTLTAFAMSDSTRFNGMLQGNVTLHDLMKSPTFTSDLQVNNFAALGDTLGNIHVKVNNVQPQVFAADLGISGQGNDVQVTGTYDTHPNVTKPLDLKMDIRKVQLHSLQGVTGNAITDASGQIEGSMKIGGSLDKPEVRGHLYFDKTRFNVAMVNSYFAIDSERVDFDETGFNFDTFTIVDSTGNEAVIDGNVYTTDYRNYKFDFDFIANNFHALNSTKKNNKNYYGQLFFDSRLWIKGTPSQPGVDGWVTVNDKTNLTLSLPQDEPGVEERKGIVEFVDHRTGQADSAVALAADSVLAASLAGMDISVNFELKKEAQVNIVIDPDNGDMLSVKGEALLNAGVDPGGNIVMTGSYEIAEGSYNLTFNVLHRKFDIKKGSTIIWKGAPTEAEADITAVYNIDAPPIDLMQDAPDINTGTTANVYRQKLPFQVQLNMKGPILKPTITFDILLPENRSYSISGDRVADINYRLDQLRKEPSELNKQVFALLLLGRFVGENPFESSAGGGLTAESFARKSASALLADQLNQLAGNLIKGVDVNFGIVSEDDY